MASVTSVRRWVSRVIGREDERGQGMVEYAMILVFVSITAIVLVAIIGHQTSNDFSNVSHIFP